MVEGIEKLLPVAVAEPPEEVVYQLTVPALAVAPNVAEPLPQILAGVVLVMVGLEYTEAVTEDRAETQPLL
jgi:hypothetical protein